MSDKYWLKCRHCSKEIYCSHVHMTHHEEDCSKRPSALAKLRVCPKCQSVLTKVLPGSWICTNDSCDFELEVVEGGKLT